jgi:Prp8 binding protein
VSGVAFSPAENPVIASGGADGVVFVGELDR